MHPSLSIMAFTASAGAGYGLLALLGAFGALGLLPAGRGVAALALALVLIAAGLLASLLHLGRPERAWRAVSQWRSSWLSREGVAALLTFVPAGLFGLGLLGWLPAWAGVACGLFAAAGGIVTVCCTAMIYASLKPIRQWHNQWVLPAYLALSLMSGALLLGGFLGPPVAPLTLVLIAAGWAVKEGYWRFIAATPAASTPESATGLPGHVRLLEAPHTEDSFLLREMGFRVARRHAARLRGIARLAAFLLPALLTAVAWAADSTLPLLLAIPPAALGLAAERWLFFAEARHTVTLYYGAARV